MDIPSEAGTPAVADEIGSHSGGSEEAPLRADARRNLALVLAAAEDLFAEEGESVSMEAIAKRAGVGVGTIYRRFPTKAALAEAVLANQIGQVSEEIRTIAALESDATAFDVVINRIVDVASSRADLKTTLLNVGADVHAVVQPAMDEMAAIIGGLLVRAQRAGMVRPDVTESDVVMLIGASCSTSEDGGKTARRLFRIIADGLHTVPAGA
jgi:AcrR family transcriptional regulator